MIRLALRCAPELADRVLAELVELAPQGVEEERAPDYVEYAIYGPPGELPELGEIVAVAGEGLVQIETTEIPDDWADRWRDFHEPVWIGERLVVRPSWEPPQASGSDPIASPGPIEIVIDPGRAFGTGAHATTSMCLELLLEQADADRGRGAATDLGTGSGVLAIAAAKLGYGPVLGCDHERAAVEAAAANAALNQVEIAVKRHNLRERPAPAAPLWIANLTAPLLLGVAQQVSEIAERERPRGLLLSGLLVGERERVAEAFGGRGYRLAGSRERGEWAALRMRL